MMSCGRDKANTETVILNFSSADNYLQTKGTPLVFIENLGPGNVQIKLDSVFMNIPVDDIEFNYRKGKTLATDRGVVVYSSVPESQVFLILGTDSDGNYFCELHTGNRVVMFNVESIDEG